MASSHMLYFVLLFILAIILKSFFDFFLDRKGLRHFKPLTPLCGFTDLGYILHNARLAGTRTEALHEAHKQHRIIRLGPNRLSFADASAIRDIYGTSTPCTKGDQYTTPGGSPNILTVVDKDLHAVKRKRMSAAFATSHLLVWEFKIADKVEKFIKQLKARSLGGASTPQGEVIDFRSWSHLFTFDAILDIALSYHSDFLREASDLVTAESAQGERRVVNLKDCLYGVNRAIEPIVWSSTFYPILKRITRLSPVWREQWRRAGAWSDVVRYLVHVRMNRETKGEQLDDLFACLLRNSKGTDLNLDISEILAETSHLLDAGSDTTSIALTNTLYYLAKCPEKLKTLQAEIDGALDGGQHIPSYKQVQALPYLRACIDEAMRLRPALSAGMQRKTPPQGAYIDGRWISGNVLVSVPAFVSHRDPILFDNPDEFTPERWLGEDANKTRHSNLTFSTGSRVCIGKNITYMEQTMLVASIVKTFDFDLISKEWTMEWEEYFNHWPKSLPLLFRTRNEREGAR